MIDWLIAHQAIVGGAVVGVLDLAFAINPKLESNGVLHWVFVQCSGKPPVPPS